MNINWQPGHMKMARDLLKSKVKVVDIVIEVLDARAPLSSKNKEIDSIIRGKPKLILLNKSDLGSKIGNTKWLKYLNEKYQKAITANAFDRGNIKQIYNEILKITKKGTLIRAMIVGIPNVGKSTLINNLSGRKGARTGNRPGITKNIQWISINNKVELLDTPGLLNPSPSSLATLQNLAFIGSIKDEVFDIEDAALKLLEILITEAPNDLEQRYKISIGDKSSSALLSEIAIKRGCIFKNKEIDYARAAVVVLAEFRKGMIGRLTLELPEY